MTTRTIVGVLAAVALALPSAAFAASASIQGPTPGATISVGTKVTLSVSTSGFSTPAYALSDSYGGSSIGPANIDGSGNFSWTPGMADIGNHVITIRVADSQGNSAQVQQTIFVTAAPAVAIDSLQPGQTANVGQNITFHIAATNFSAPNYALSDAAASTTLTAQNVTNSGYVSWTPTAADAGAHTITATVTDPQGYSATASIDITVVAPTDVSTSGATNATALVGVPFSFGLAAQGMTNPVFSVRDSFVGSTVSSSSIDSTGHFSWTPVQSDVGGHTLIVTASDAYAHVANVTVEVEVRATVSTGSSVSGSLGSGGASPTKGSGLSAAQAQAILSLLESFGADASTIAKVQTALIGGSSTAPHAMSFVSPLTLGDSGAEVTALQQKLLQLGFFSGEATGYFGPMTQAALKAFQSAHGLEAAGSVGPLTRALLNQ